MNISAMVTGLIMLIVGIVVVFYIVGATASTLTTASTNISGSGLPLASLFGSNGVVLMIIMAGILIAIITVALKAGKSK